MTQQPGPVDPFQSAYVSFCALVVAVSEGDWPRDAAAVSVVDFLKDLGVSPIVLSALHTRWTEESRY